jgi:hypothetical protein
MKRSNRMKAKLLGAIAIAIDLGLSCPAALVAQPAPLAPRTHSGATMMGARAHSLQAHVAQEIEKAKAAGKDVSGAQSDKDQADAALKAGHYRIAVEHYQAAEKALSGK